MSVHAIRPDWNSEPISTGTLLRTSLGFAAAALLCGLLAYAVIGML